MNNNNSSGNRRLTAQSHALYQNSNFPLAGGLATTPEAQEASLQQQQRQSSLSSSTAIASYNPNDRVLPLPVDPMDRRVPKQAKRYQAPTVPMSSLPQHVPVPVSISGDGRGSSSAAGIVRTLPMPMIPSGHDNMPNQCNSSSSHPRDHISVPTELLSSHEPHHQQHHQHHGFYQQHQPTRHDDMTSLPPNPGSSHAPSVTSSKRRRTRKVVECSNPEGFRTSEELRVPNTTTALSTTTTSAARRPSSGLSEPQQSSSPSAFSPIRKSPSSSAARRDNAEGSISTSRRVPDPMLVDSDPWQQQQQQREDDSLAELSLKDLAVPERPFNSAEVRREVLLRKRRTESSANPTTATSGAQSNVQRAPSLPLPNASPSVSIATVPAVSASTSGTPRQLSAAEKRNIAIHEFMKRKVADRIKEKKKEREERERRERMIEERLESLDGFRRRQRVVHSQVSGNGVAAGGTSNSTRRGEKEIGMAGAGVGVDDRTQAWVEGGGSPPRVDAHVVETGEGCGQNVMNNQGAEGQNFQPGNSKGIRESAPSRYGEQRNQEGNASHDLRRTQSASAGVDQGDVDPSSMRNQHQQQQQQVPSTAPVLGNFFFEARVPEPQTQSAPMTGVEQAAHEQQVPQPQQSQQYPPLPSDTRPVVPPRPTSTFVNTASQVSQDRFTTPPTPPLQPLEHHADLLRLQNIMAAARQIDYRLQNFRQSALARHDNTDDTIDSITESDLSFSEIGDGAGGGQQRYQTPPRNHQSHHLSSSSGRRRVPDESYPRPSQRSSSPNVFSPPRRNLSPSPSRRGSIVVDSGGEGEIGVGSLSAYAYALRRGSSVGSVGSRGGTPAGERDNGRSSSTRRRLFVDDDDEGGGGGRRGGGGGETGGDRESVGAAAVVIQRFFKKFWKVKGHEFVDGGGGGGPSASASAGGRGSIDAADSSMRFRDGGEFFRGGDGGLNGRRGGEFQRSSGELERGRSAGGAGGGGRKSIVGYDELPPPMAEDLMGVVRPDRYSVLNVYSRRFEGRESGNVRSAFEVYDGGRGGVGVGAGAQREERVVDEGVLPNVGRSGRASVNEPGRVSVQSGVSANATSPKVVRPVSVASARDSPGTVNQRASFNDTVEYTDDFENVDVSAVSTYSPRARSRKGSAYHGAEGLGSTASVVHMEEFPMSTVDDVSKDDSIFEDLRGSKTNVNVKGPGRNGKLVDVGVITDDVGVGGTNRVKDGKKSPGGSGLTITRSTDLTSSSYDYTTTTSSSALDESSEGARTPRGSRKRGAYSKGDRFSKESLRYEIEKGGKMSPNSLSRRMIAELNYLETVQTAHEQLTELERNRGIAMANQETISVANLLREKSDSHQRELEGARKAREELELKVLRRQSEPSSRNRHQSSETPTATSSSVVSSESQSVLSSGNVTPRGKESRGRFGASASPSRIAEEKYLRDDSFEEIESEIESGGFESGSRAAGGSISIGERLDDEISAVLDKRNKAGILVTVTGARDSKSRGSSSKAMEIDEDLVTKGSAISEVPEILEGSSVASPSPVPSPMSGVSGSRVLPKPDLTEFIDLDKLLTDIELAPEAVKTVTAAAVNRDSGLNEFDRTDILLDLKERTLEDQTRSEIKLLRAQRLTRMEMGSPGGVLDPLASLSQDLEKSILMKYAAEKAEIERRRQENADAREKNLAAERRSPQQEKKNLSKLKTPSSPVAPASRSANAAASKITQAESPKPRFSKLSSRASAVDSEISEDLPSASAQTPSAIEEEFGDVPMTEDDIAESDSISTESERKQSSTSHQSAPNASKRSSVASTPGDDSDVKRRSTSSTVSSIIARLKQNSTKPPDTAALERKQRRLEMTEAIAERMLSERMEVSQKKQQMRQQESRIHRLLDQAEKVLRDDDEEDRKLKRQMQDELASSKVAVSPSRVSTSVAGVSAASPGRPSSPKRNKVSPGHVRAPSITLSEDKDVEDVVLQQGRDSVSSIAEDIEIEQDIVSSIAESIQVDSPSGSDDSGGKSLREVTEQLREERKAVAESLEAVRLQASGQLTPSIVEDIPEQGDPVSSVPSKISSAVPEQEAGFLRTPSFVASRSLSKTGSVRSVDSRASSPQYDDDFEMEQGGETGAAGMDLNLELSDGELSGDGMEIKSQVAILLELRAKVEAKKARARELDLERKRKSQVTLDKLGRRQQELLRELQKLDHHIAKNENQLAEMDLDDDLASKADLSMSLPDRSRDPKLETLESDVSKMYKETDALLREIERQKAAPKPALPTAIAASVKPEPAQPVESKDDSPSVAEDIVASETSGVSSIREDIASARYASGFSTPKLSAAMDDASRQDSVKDLGSAAYEDDFIHESESSAKISVAGYDEVVDKAQSVDVPRPDDTVESIKESIVEEVISEASDFGEEEEEEELEAVAVLRETEKPGEVITGVDTLKEEVKVEPVVVQDDVSLPGTELEVEEAPGSERDAVPEGAGHETPISPESQSSVFKVAITKDERVEPLFAGEEYMKRAESVQESDFEYDEDFEAEQSSDGALSRLSEAKATLIEPTLEKPAADSVVVSADVISEEIEIEEDIANDSLNSDSGVKETEPSIAQRKEKPTAELEPEPALSLVLTKEDIKSREGSEISASPESAREEPIPPTDIEEKDAPRKSDELLRKEADFIASELLKEAVDDAVLAMSDARTEKLKLARLDEEVRAREKEERERKALEALNAKADLITNMIWNDLLRENQEAIAKSQEDKAISSTTVEDAGEAFVEEAAAQQEAVPVKADEVLEAEVLEHLVIKAVVDDENEIVLEPHIVDRHIEEPRVPIKSSDLDSDSEEEEEEEEEDFPPPTLSSRRLARCEVNESLRSSVASIASTGVTLTSSKFAADFIAALLEQLPPPTNPRGYDQMPVVDRELTDGLASPEDPDAVQERYYLLVDAANECLEQLFAEHEQARLDAAAGVKDRPRRGLPPRPIPSAMVKETVISTIRKWSAYSETYGENLDTMLIQEVKEDEKKWRSVEDEEFQVKERLVEMLMNGLISDTVVAIEMTLKAKYEGHDVSVV
ncbi:hypothetical protein HDU76_008817 [Blyttiomyces sp. JEL0837]|nr:hypothetical protein HDU76_008817 [Blyttiomyces sp. JEL0837]